MRSAAPAKPAPSAKSGAARKKGGCIVNVGVMTVATGLIATMSLPAFAFNPDGVEKAGFGPSASDTMKKAQSQSVEVGGVASAAVNREEASATSETELQSRKAAEAAAAAAAAA